MPTDDKIDDIRGDLAGAMTELEGPTDAKEPAAAPATAAPDESSGEEAPEGAPDETEQPEASGEPAAGGVAAAPQLDAPHHWPSAAREMFAKQTPEGKQFLLERHKAMEGDYTKKMQEFTPARRLQEGINELFASRRQAMRLQGIDELGAIKQLVAAHEYLETNPAEAIRWLADKYGADLSAPAGTNGGEPADPRYQQLQTKFTQIERQLQLDSQRREQEQFANALSQVEKFAAEKDAQGQPAHPFLNEVTKEVSRLIKIARQEGETLSIQDAYDAAIHANPVTRAKVRAAEDATRKATEDKERKAKADAARRAASGDVRGEGAASPGAARHHDNLRAELSANYDKASSGRV